MARLTYQQRKRIPARSYAMPSGTAARRAKAPSGGKQPKGSFPVTDKPRARNALARAHQPPHGPMSAADRAVHAKVREKYPELYAQHMAEAHGKSRRKAG